MAQSKQIYLKYWKELKHYIDELGLDWRFPSFDGHNETVVRIGSPKHGVCLALVGTDGKNGRPSVSVSFWIPDSKEAYHHLVSHRMKIEAEMGKMLVWDCVAGRKSCWIRMATVMDLSNEKSWPMSFEWFAQNAQKIRDVCDRYLNE